MGTAFSLRKRLIRYTSIFSILLGCVLIFSAYKISLEEINEILDAQMVYLAERVELNLDLFKAISMSISAIMRRIYL